MTNKPRVKLVGEDGNAFAILARCHTAMKRSGDMSKWDEFHDKAREGDYDHLLRTVMEYFYTFGEEDYEDN